MKRVIPRTDHENSSRMVTTSSSSQQQQQQPMREYIWISMDMIDYMLLSSSSSSSKNRKTNSDYDQQQQQHDDTAEQRTIHRIPNNWQQQLQQHSSNYQYKRKRNNHRGIIDTMTNSTSQQSQNTTSSATSSTYWGWIRAVVLHKEQKSVPSSSSSSSSQQFNTITTATRTAPMDDEHDINDDTDSNDKKFSLYTSVQLRKPIISPPISISTSASSSSYATPNMTWKQQQSTTRNTANSNNNNNNNIPTTTQQHQMTIQIQEDEFLTATSSSTGSLQNRKFTFIYTTNSNDTSRTSNDTNSTIAGSTCSNFIHKCNDWWIQQHQQPQSSMDTVPPDNLTELEQLHEPAVLYCLYRRYMNHQCTSSSSSSTKQQLIYTYTGKILIAINPFIHLPYLYGDTIMELYHTNNNTSKTTAAMESPNHYIIDNTNRRNNIAAAASPPPPHIYAIAQDAYASAIQSITPQTITSEDSVRRKKKTNQCILVSGESGAGKTVTTKIILQYFARLSSSSSSSSSVPKNQRPKSPTSSTTKSVLSPRRRRHITAKVETDTSSTTTNDRQIELQVLESNPILESFGNARTIRNDNSSRFGKYIEIHFDTNGSIIAATIETYLLEKVRLIAPSYNERNYHIFYELLTPSMSGGLSPQERQKLHISNKSVHDFHITCMSQTYERDRDHVKDRDTYRELRKALDIVGFTRSEQMDLFTVICALLYISNLTFVPSNYHQNNNKRNSHNYASTGNADASTLDTSNPSLPYALELLGVDLETLNNALCTCTIEAPRNEILIKQLSIDRATKAVEAFMKTTYTALFNYIVSKINHSFVSVMAEQQRQVNGRPDSDDTVSIGVLDIFGFESFERNSFEQLCINYCNEALQQQFNKFVFKLEQLEYEQEQIDWSFISFPDNQDVLDLIEKRHDGIISILDEQCRLPRCTDATFANAIYQKYINKSGASMPTAATSSSHPRLVVSKAMQAQSAFAIHHYAGLVEYTTEGFIEKNQDELPKSTTELLQSSSNPFFVTLGLELSSSDQKQISTENNIGQLQNAMSPNLRVQRSPMNLRSNNTGSQTPPFQRSNSSLLRDSVGTQFSNQLKTLRTRIELTSPHYVRCLKPNDELIPNNFDSNVIADQLRCAGVLEAIRVSRVGFPHRYYHDHFIGRYGVLEPNLVLLYQQQQQPYLADRINKKNTSKVIWTPLERKEQCVLLVNLVSAKLLHTMTLSDNYRSSVETSSGQSHDGVILEMQVGKTKVFIQSRAYEILEQMRSKKLRDSAIFIQTLVRKFLCRINFEVTISAIQLIQRFLRCQVAFRLARILRIDRAIKIIQRAVRCAKARKYLHLARYVACWCQSAYRGAIARQYCAYLFLDLKATCIQKAWKNSKTNKYSIRSLRNAIITLQTRHRCHTAARVLRQLRLEARDIALLAAERDKYREESNRLKRELEEVKASPEKFLKPPPSPGRTSEMERLRVEVQDLHLELEKFHRMSSPSKSVDDRADQLLGELARKEDELKFLRREVAALRSKDDVSSTIKSMTIDTTTHSSSAGPVRSITSPRHRASPVRSDVSLLDDETDDDEIIHASNYNFQPYENEDLNDDNDVSNAVDDGESDANEDLRHLHTAIRQKSRRHLDQILHQTSEVCVLINQGDRYGRTAMHLAAITLDVQIAEILLNRGAVVNAQDDDGETPLHLAENAQMTEFLIKKGKANPNIPNIDGICALHLAVQRRDIDSVRILVRYGANVNNADNIRWFTALHLVALPARTGINEAQLGDDVRCRIAELLAGGDYGATTNSGGRNDGIPTDDNENNVKPDLNYQDSEGNTPLHYAVQLESTDAYTLINLLLERSANPNVQNSRGQVPFHLLCHNNHLRTAFRFQYIEIINALLKHNADPSVTSQTGCTALHLAVYHRDIDTAIVLIQGGATLHILWKKPKRWKSFWTTPEIENKDPKKPKKDIGVLAIDMIEDSTELYRILLAITKRPRILAPVRSYCMNCKLSFVPPISRSNSIASTSITQKLFSSTSGVPPSDGSKLSNHNNLHCRRCSRSICTNCCTIKLSDDIIFPGNNDVSTTRGTTVNGKEEIVLWPCCTVCESIILSQRNDMNSNHPFLHHNNVSSAYKKEIMSHGTQPTTSMLSSYFEDDDNEHHHVIIPNNDHRYSNKERFSC